MLFNVNLSLTKVDGYLELPYSKMNMLYCQVFFFYSRQILFFKSIDAMGKMLHWL